METVTKEILIKFTEEEFAGCAKTLAILAQEKAEIEAEFSETKIEFKKKIEEKEEEMQQLFEQISRGGTEQTRECEMHKDFARNTITYRSITTGEVLDTRPMDESDHQETLPFAGVGA